MKVLFSSALSRPEQVLLAALLAAWPVLAVMHNRPQFKLHRAAKAWA